MPHYGRLWQYWHLVSPGSSFWRGKLLFEHRAKFCWAISGQRQQCWTCWHGTVSWLWFVHGSSRRPALHSLQLLLQAEKITRHPFEEIQECCDTYTMTYLYCGVTCRQNWKSPFVQHKATNPRWLFDDDVEKGINAYSCTKKLLKSRMWYWRYIWYWRNKVLVSVLILKLPTLTL